MVEHFIERFAFMLGFTALTLCIGLLLLLAAREVYEVDSRRKEVRDPLGEAHSTWEYVLMSDFAQNARTELKLLGQHFSKILRILVWTVVVLYGIDFLIQLVFFCVTHVVWLPNWVSRAALWAQSTWKQFGEAEYLARYGLSLVVMFCAPFFVARTAAILRHVIRAKDEPMTNKDPWWASAEP